MVGLLLERVPGLPERVQVEVGEQRALVLDGARAARRLADLVSGLADPPAGSTVRATGPVRLVPAEGGLLPHLTVLGNVLHGHRISHGRVRTIAVEECRAAAGRCGLEDVLDRYPHEITAGRRRMAGVARALRGQPTVIVLEDATGLPTWGSLLSPARNPELLSAALLLVTTSVKRAAGFGDG